MYTDYWRIREKPFENNWDLRFYYLSSQHKEVLTRLLYAVKENRQGALLTGAHGSGKSMVLKLLANKLQTGDGQYPIIHIKDPMMSIEEFYLEFLLQLGVRMDDSARCGSKSALSKKFVAELVKRMDNSQYSVLIIDESHLMEQKTLEEMRLLLNNYHPENNSNMLTLILAGQPELSEKIRGIPALGQRIPVRCDFALLDGAQCVEYVFHRLRVAGSQNQLFTDDALELVWEYSKGVPRSINNICDMALFLGSSRGAVKVDGGVIEEVARDIEDSLRS